MKRNVSIGMVLCALIGFVAGLIAVGWQQFRQPDQKACMVEQSIVIENQGDEPVMPDALYIWIPPNNERQQVKFVGISPAGLQVTEDGQIVTVRGLHAMTRGDEYRLVYSLSVKTRRTEALQEPQTVASDTAPETDIESDNDLIIQKAEELSRGAESTEERAYKFYNYVASSVEFNAEMEPGDQRSAFRMPDTTPRRLRPQSESANSIVPGFRHTGQERERLYPPEVGEVGRDSRME